MNIQTLDQTADLENITGLVIVIDVLRAFSTACFLVKNGAENIYPIGDLERARKLKVENPNWVLIGEREGYKLSDADYGNSPSELKDVDLSGKTVIFTTSAGTQPIKRLTKADKIISGAFVNATAIADFIIKSDYENVTFICTDNRWIDNEDYKLAEFVTALVENGKANFESEGSFDKHKEFANIKKHMMEHPGAKGFLKTPRTEYSKEDFELAFSLDLFDFVIEVGRGGEEKMSRLKKIS